MIGISLRDLWNGEQTQCELCSGKANHKDERHIFVLVGPSGKFYICEKCMNAAVKKYKMKLKELHEEGVI